VNGLFAEHGLDVEILDPSGGPDNVVRVGEGSSDFALTSTNYFDLGWPQTLVRQGKEAPCW